MPAKEWNGIPIFSHSSEHGVMKCGLRKKSLPVSYLKKIHFKDIFIMEGSASGLHFHSQVYQRKLRWFPKSFHTAWLWVDHHQKQLGLLSPPWSLTTCDCSLTFPCQCSYAHSLAGESQGLGQYIQCSCFGSYTLAEE